MLAKLPFLRLKNIVFISHCMAFLSSLVSTYLNYLCFRVCTIYLLLNKVFNLIRCIDIKILYPQAFLLFQKRDWAEDEGNEKPSAFIQKGGKACKHLLCRINLDLIIPGNRYFKKCCIKRLFFPMSISIPDYQTISTSLK